MVQCRRQRKGKISKFFCKCGTRASIMSIFYLMPLRVHEPEANYSQFQGDYQQQKGHNW